MPGTWSKVKTVITGETITASDRNAEFNNVITNCDFSGLGDYSPDNATMQSTADPYPADAESLATDGKGELERIRYQLKTQFGLTQWYHDLTTPVKTLQEALLSYRRPNLVWVSATTVDVENNTGTANQTKIIFPDGNVRSVTEDTSSAHKYRRFIITATSEYTSGTEDSGLENGVSETVNTWYMIYAVKSAVDSSKFVLTGRATSPIQGNVSANLDNDYGANGWVYLGSIRNGDNSGSTGDILKFMQAGNVFLFNNTCTGNAHNLMGTRLSSSAGTTTLTWTYAAGTGATQIPAHIKTVQIQSAITNEASSMVRFQGQVASGTFFWRTNNEVGEVVYPHWQQAAEGGSLVTSIGGSTAKDINLTGWIDGALGFPNALI